MDLLIYSEDYVPLGIVDTASSIIWANRFRQCGDFELYVPASAAMVDLLQEDRLVGRYDDEMLCIIEKAILTTDQENGDYLTVTGRCLRSILDRRIVWDQTSMTGTVENVLRRLVTDAFISPAIPERKYDKLTLAPAHGYTETVTVQYTGDNVLTAIEELCAANNYGFKITLQDGMLVVDFFKAADRSENQSENVPVVFSEEYDNLTTSTYTKDKTAYKNVALVAGEGEGSARKRISIIKAQKETGLARREMYVDARDLSTNEGEIDAATYMEQLRERGRTSMAEASRVESLEGQVEHRQMYTYGKDYNIGDTVSVITKYGVHTITQALEVVEVWDESGYTCTPTFG